MASMKKSNPSRSVIKLLASMLIVFVIMSGVSFFKGVIFGRQEDRADNGDIQAAYLVGLRYLEGNNPDYPRAKFYLQKAADKGHGQAAYQLGLMYAEADEKHPDYQRAKVYLQEAVDKNIPGAANDLGVVYSRQGDYAKGLDLYKIAAQSGDGYGMYNIGLAYSLLGKGNPPNALPQYSQALYWYKQSLKDNAKCGRNDLGILYARGLGVQQDKTVAYNYFYNDVFDYIAHDSQVLSIQKNSGLGVDNFAKAYANYQVAKLTNTPNNDVNNNQVNAVNAIKAFESKIEDTCWR